MSAESESERKSYTFSTDDPQLQDFLDDVENRSEVLREGARKMAWERYGMQMDAEDLSEDQRTAYGWLMENTQGESVRLESVRNKLAQLVQLDKDLVQRSIIHPMANKGYIRVLTGMYSVKVKPVPPSEVSADE